MLAACIRRAVQSRSHQAVFQFLERVAGDHIVARIDQDYPSKSKVHLVATVKTSDLPNQYAFEPIAVEPRRCWHESIIFDFGLSEDPDAVPLVLLDLQIVESEIASDAGRVARRKYDVQPGIIVILRDAGTAEYWTGASHSGSEGDRVPGDVESSRWCFFERRFLRRS